VHLARSGGAAAPGAQQRRRRGNIGARHRYLPLPTLQNTLSIENQRNGWRRYILSLPLSFMGGMPCNGDGMTRSALRGETHAGIDAP